MRFEVRRFCESRLLEGKHETIDVQALMLKSIVIHILGELPQPDILASLILNWSKEQPKNQFGWALYVGYINKQIDRVCASAGREPRITMVEIQLWYLNTCVCRLQLD